MLIIDMRRLETGSNDLGSDEPNTSSPLNTTAPISTPTLIAPIAAPNTMAPTAAPNTMAITAASNTMAPTAAPATTAPTAAPTAHQTLTAPTAAFNTMAPTAAPNSTVPTAAPTATPTLIAHTAALNTMAPTAAPNSTVPTAAPTATPTLIAHTAASNTTAPTAAPNTIALTASLNTMAPSAAPTPIAPTPALNTMAPTAAPTLIAPTAALNTMAPTAAPNTTAITPASNSTESNATGLLAGVIVLAILLAVVVLGNIICFACYRRKKRSSSQLSDNAEPHQGNDSMLHELETERNRRLKAEAIIARTKPGGLRMSDFPKARDVLKNLDHTSESAFTWINEVSEIVSSQATFGPTMQSVLVNTFVVSSETIRQNLDDRMQNLSAFLGSSEPVTLSSGNSMNLDTQFVLYESLCKNYQAIVPMESDNMRGISNAVLRRCKGVADADLAKAMIFGKPWSSYQTLLKSYITVMIECALQNPPMVFMDDLGKDANFDPVVHRNWGQSEAMSRGDRCIIVFPALQPQQGRSQSTYKIGVIRVAS